MKVLTLLRHAKSSWDDTVQRDFDRPLNDKGRRAAVAVGRHLRAEGLVFDHVLASPARRVIETLEGVAEGYGAQLTPVWERGVYMASAYALLEFAAALPDAAGRALLVGHNPGLEDLAQLCARPGALRDALVEKYPTATLAELTFDAERWAGVREGGAELTRFTRPRDLDPALGPDED